MTNYHWAGRFQEIYDLAVERYKDGHQTPKSMLKPDEIQWLATIGCSPRELFDFVEDYCRGGEPDPGTALLLAAQRRAYFLDVQHGKQEKELPNHTLPPKNQAVEGIQWLPRLIEKAKRKLRGQMDPDLMYGCGGDRSFFKQFNLHPSDFLKVVEDSKGDDTMVIQFIVSRVKN